MVITKPYIVSNNMKYHLKSGISLFENIFRIGSESYVGLIEEARSLYNKGVIQLNKSELELINSNIGNKILYEGEYVYEDIPFRFDDDKCVVFIGENGIAKRIFFKAPILLKEKKDLPFDKIGNDIRLFSSDVEEGELKWHEDAEDRIVFPVYNKGWKIQLDNELPAELKNETYIPKGVFHRIIKGNGDLVVKVLKMK